MFSLLADSKAKVESFWEFVRQMQVLNSYPTSLIVNVDQRLLFLEMPQERTLETKGARTVHVRTAGYEKERLTVMLAVTASGLNLPPYVVFKHKTIPKVVVPRGTGMDGREPCPGLDYPSPRPLHAAPTGRGLQAEGRPPRPGLISRTSHRGRRPDYASLQADTGGVRHRYDTWFEGDGITSTTPAGNLKKPPTELLLKWIDEAWADVPEAMVRKAFLTCGISNAEDGSQDNMILAHMWDSDEVEVLEDVMEEEQDELVPNLFYPAPVVTPPDVTVEMEEEAVLAAEAEEADEEAVPTKSDSSKSDNGNANEADEWSNEGDEWWAPGRYEGAEVEEWVAGDEDE
ncbi:unnamed protein product [Closterium sp. NIES-53]